MTPARRSQLAILAVAVIALLLCVTPTSRPAGEALPDRLDDRTFWTLVTEFSEPNGSFRSDNLVSNETVFQYVIPALQDSLMPASAYLGVGPDQNFTYIAALKPRIAFIVDIRRQNLLLHLMYKALIEMSPTREEFLSRLFSRPVPSRTSPRDSPDTLLAAFSQIEADQVAFERTREEIYDRLQHGHGFTLTAADLRGIEYVYGAFYRDGPLLRYSVGRPGGWQPFPTYRDLMVADDGRGVQRSYIASEELYATLRDMQERNLIVPLVGDFAGPKALRSVGRYLDLHHATVSAFYTSNVEQYLFSPRDAAWQRFYDNVSALPIAGRSTFIRAYFANQGRVMRMPDPSMAGTPIGPRSQTLLNPIAALLEAYGEGHIGSYYDVIELSSPK